MILHNVAAITRYHNTWKYDEIVSKKTSEQGKKMLKKEKQCHQPMIGKKHDLELNRYG